MQTVEIKSKNDWDDAGIHFLQSWGWSEVLISEGARVGHLAVTDGNSVVALAQAAYYSLPLGRQYAFCPKGPHFFSPDAPSRGEVYATLQKYFFQKNLVFFRIEPAEISSGQNWQKITDINPRATVMLDLRQSLEEILAGMHPKTRYNIRLAEKKNLRVSTEKNFEDFFRLMRVTGRRDKFHLHNAEHYRRVLASKAVSQITAYADGEKVATAVFFFHGGTVTYLYGASDYAHRQLMAPYLIQWEGIKAAKNVGAERYDFFGVAPWKKDEAGKNIYNEEHRYAGVTRFKMGFGGEYLERPGTFDIVLNRREYAVYKILRQVRRIF